MQATTVGAIVSAIVAMIWLRSRSIWSELPPGPSRFSLMLRKKEMKAAPYLVFTSLNDTYGSVVSFFLGRKTVIVLGSLKAATELLEKRGNIYSSRPRNVMAVEILSGGRRGVGLPYGQKWRNWRFLLHAGMSIEAIHGYKTIQLLESSLEFGRILQEQDRTKYSSRLRRLVASVAMVVGYGRRVDTLDDPRVTLNMNTERTFGKFTTPGRYIVEQIPELLYLPKALQWFRPEPERCRLDDEALYMNLLNTVRKEVEAGTAHPSTASRGIQRQEEFGLEDMDLAYGVSSPWSGGVGTTMSLLEYFILAMIYHPDVMKRAQKEIDNVVGRERMPDFDDYPKLVYVQALIKETMRWRPIAPLGAPHAVIQDDEYEGMYIPNGCTVTANIHAMTRNPEMFPSPEEFLPERYLENDKLPHNFLFGFGRRICPGIHLARNTSFLVIARLLWAFNILPDLDSDGKEVFPPLNEHEGILLIRPVSLTYRLVLRDGDLRVVIEREAESAKQQLKAWD